MTPNSTEKLEERIEAPAVSGGRCEAKRTLRVRTGLQAGADVTFYVEQITLKMTKTDA